MSTILTPNSIQWLPVATEFFFQVEKKLFLHRKFYHMNLYLIKKYFISRWMDRLIFLMVGFRLMNHLLHFCCIKSWESIKCNFRLHKVVQCNIKFKKEYNISYLYLHKLKGVDPMKIVKWSPNSHKLTLWSTRY